MSCGLSNGCGSDDCPEQESDKVPSWLVDSEEYLVQFGVGSTSLMQGEDIRHEIVAGRIVCDMPDNEVPFASAEWAGV
jgi:hypothetical protein